MLKVVRLAMLRNRSSNTVAGEDSARGRVRAQRGLMKKIMMAAAVSPSGMMAAVHLGMAWAAQITMTTRMKRLSFRFGP